MNFTKQKTRLFFYAEMTGAGMYRAMAEQYSRKPELSSRFRLFGDQEAMHGRLFREHYRKISGKTLAGENLCMLNGKIYAYMTGLIPLRAKLKMMSLTEAIAAANIEMNLEKPDGSDGSGFYKIMKRIFPDEKAHAGLYDEIYGKK